MSGPYPYPPRPYSKGFSREEDEKLAEELFYGTTVRDKTGRDCHRYPSEDSLHVEALCRLLLFSDLPSEIIGGLLCSLDKGGSFGRRLVFKQRKRKRPVGAATDLQITLYVQSLKRAEWPVDAAVANAEKKFGLSRKGVYGARKRIKAESPWLVDE